MMNAPREGLLMDYSEAGGVRILASRRKDMNSLAILVTFRDGVAYENEQEWGISHFLEHLHLLGTPEYPSLTAISGELECQGGQISAFSTRDSTNYWVRIPSPGLGSAFSVLSSVLRNSDFDPAVVESEKAIIMKEMEREKSNFRLYNALNLESSLLSPFRIRRYPLGSLDSVSSFTGDLLTRYAGEVYGRRNCSMAICGAFQEKALRAHIGRFVESLPEGRERLFSPPGSAGGCSDGALMEIEYGSLSQITMATGWTIGDDMKEKWLTFSLLNTLLGVGFSCLLYRILRERHRLTYLVTTQLTAYSADVGGAFRITLDVDPSKAGEALALIKETVRAVREGHIGKDDFSRARAQLWGSMVLRMDDAMEHARFLSRRMVQRCGPLTMAGIREELFALTAEDLAHCAARYCGEDTMKISLAGSREALLTARKSMTAL
jgi:predicted Zn-dependent peptidase